MSSTPNSSTKLPSRKAEDYVNVTRFISQNHFLTEAKKIKKESPFYKTSDFFTKTVWSWLYFYLQSRFGPRCKYPQYILPETGVYKIDEIPELKEAPISLVICSDWATDTPESFAIAEKMRQHDPAFTVHVGDTYYVGAPHEIKRNFTNEGSPWVRGKAGSFALLGNHEMYARGIAFFKYLLPSLGLKDEQGKYLKQKAGYFCLETNHWRILGLDTGFHSIGIPLLEFISWFSPDGRMDKTLLNWLEKSVNLGDPNDKRGILVLTHHQYLSAFNEEEFTRPAKQLAKLLGTTRKIIWLWGHEHKFTMYEKTGIKDGITAYGRCIGHGGTPVELDAKSFKFNAKKNGYGKLVLKDDRENKIVNKNRLGHNGYALLALHKENLTISYCDEEAILLTEQWRVEPDGNIIGKIDIPDHCALKTEPGKEWEDLVK